VLGVHAEHGHRQPAVVADAPEHDLLALVDREDVPGAADPVTDLTCVQRGGPARLPERGLLADREPAAHQREQHQDRERRHQPCAADVRRHRRRLVEQQRHGGHPAAGDHPWPAITHFVLGP
jgi:hypothetical protein